MMGRVPAESSYSELVKVKDQHCAVVKNTSEILFERVKTLVDASGFDRYFECSCSFKWLLCNEGGTA